MPQLLLVDFALGAPGTPVQPDLYTPEGVHVVLPNPSKIIMAGSKTGIEIPDKVALTLPYPASELAVRGGAWANAPAVRFLGTDGALLNTVQPTVQPDHGIAAQYASKVPIGGVALEYPTGEGVLFTLAAWLQSEPAAKR
jgi:hypothetical protein